MYICVLRQRLIPKYIHTECWPNHITSQRNFRMFTDKYYPCSIFCSYFPELFQMDTRVTQKHTWEPARTHRRWFTKQRDWETPEKSRPIPAGGRRQGGGERGKLSPREATPSHPANRPRVLSRDFLRPDRRRTLGPRREEARRTRGEGAQASGCLNRWGGEDTKRRRNRIRTFVEDPKTGTALNAGPTPYRAAGSLSSVDGEGTDTPVRGKPSVARTRWVLPTHSDVCLQHPALPQQDWTELANLRDHLRPPVSGQKLDTKETANRSQINKGNRFRKDRCNRLKSLKVTPTTPEGAYRYREV